MTMTERDEVVHAAQMWLSPEVPLSVHLVTGTNYSVLVDTGVAKMSGQIRNLIADHLARPSDLKIIVNTHAHHDHMGSNASTAALTGALVGATSVFAHWHTDMDRHYAEFALEHPDLVPDDPQLKHDLMSTIDAPHPVDLIIDDGFVMDLGGGVSLETFALPGHMDGEVGFLERSTGTLILGDSLIGTEWSFFHGYYDVDVYLASLRKMRATVTGESVQCVRAAHHPAMSGSDGVAAIDHIVDSIAATEDAVRAYAATHRDFTLGDAWRTVSDRFGKTRCFRGLRVVEAHLTALTAQGLIEASGDDTFRCAGEQ